MPRSVCRDKSGSIAVEFAFILPILITIVFGVIAYSTLYATMHAVQQLASEAARASVAGLDDTERGTIVSNYISANATSYIFIDPQKLTSSANTIAAQNTNYQVTLNYDNSASFIYMFAGVLPLPPSKIQRTAVIVRGGY